jgi:hypothetical protein
VTFNEEGSEDETGNPIMTIEFECVNCGLEYDGVYHLTNLWCVNRRPNGGGGEIPLDFEEGQRLLA